MLNSQYRPIHEFIFASPAMSHMSYLSYLNGLWDGKQVAIQLPFYWVLFSGLLNTAHRILVSFTSSSSLYILLVSMLCMDTAITWRNLFFFSSDWLDFFMINSQSVAFHVYAKCMLTPLSVDEILLLRYVNWSPNFRGLRLFI